jgi:hypothetical protein
MKVTTHSADEMVLTEGAVTGIVIGVALVIAGGLVDYYSRSSNPVMVWAGLALAVAGVVAVLLSSSITVTANRTTAQLRYQKKRQVGAQDTTCASTDVFRIETRKTAADRECAELGAAGRSSAAGAGAGGAVGDRLQRRPGGGARPSEGLGADGCGLRGIDERAGAETAMAAQVAKFPGGGVPGDRAAESGYGDQYHRGAERRVLRPGSR